MDKALQTIRESSNRPGLCSKYSYIYRLEIGKKGVLQVRKLKTDRYMFLTTRGSIGSSLNGYTVAEPDQFCTSYSMLASTIEAYQKTNKKLWSDRIRSIEADLYRCRQQIQAVSVDTLDIIDDTGLVISTINVGESGG